MKGQNDVSENFAVSFLLTAEKEDVDEEKADLGEEMADLGFEELKKEDQYLEMEPPKSDVDDQYLEGEPPKSDVGNQYSEGEPPKSDVEDQYLEREPPKSDVDDQYLEWEQSRTDVDDHYLEREQPKTDVEDQYLEKESPKSDVDDQYLERESPKSDVDDQYLEREQPKTDVDDQYLEKESPKSDVDDQYLERESPKSDVDDQYLEREPPESDVDDQYLEREPPESDVDDQYLEREPPKSHIDTQYLVREPPKSHIDTQYLVREPPKFDIDDQYMEREPQKSDIDNQYLEMEPPKSDIDDQYLEKESPKSDIDDQYLEREPQKSDIDDQYMEREPQKSDIDNQYLEREPPKFDIDDQYLEREPPKSDIDNLYLEREPPTSDARLRSPICCVIGEASIGKTMLLDCIRGTDANAECYAPTEGITATNIPSEIILERSNGLMKSNGKISFPGLLFLDTPGFTYYEKLVSKGLSLCDIAVLVVDIMFGLHPFTLNSLYLLRGSNKKFIIVVNQLDRLSGWKPCENATFDKAFQQQSLQVQNSFHVKLTQIITQFKEYGIDTKLYFSNKDMGETVSIVPTCAKSGEGISDMLFQLVMWTQKPMVEKLSYKEELQCTVLNANYVDGWGASIDVVLVNGTLHEGDQIVVCGSQGKIVTSIQFLLTPSPMKLIGAKGTCIKHTKIEGGSAFKIIAQGLQNAIAGHDLYVVKPDGSKNVEEEERKKKGKKDNSEDFDVSLLTIAKDDGDDEKSVLTVNADAAAAKADLGYGQASIGKITPLEMNDLLWLLILCHGSKNVEEEKKKKAKKDNLEDGDDEKLGLTTERVFVYKNNAAAAAKAGLGFEKPKNDDPYLEREPPKSDDDPYLEREPPTSDARLRSPICCVIGEASIGKTMLLDCIRGTDANAEPYAYTKGITATNIPYEIILERSNGLMKPNGKISFPGLLFLDTPGFTYYENLVSKGLSLCDIAVLVVDIMFGLHPFTLNSLYLLRDSNKKFILVVNQLDRLSGWKPCENATFDKAFQQQSLQVQNAFHVKLTQIIAQFKEYGIDTKLYFSNKDMGETVSIVPTCAKSGEGISDMLLQLIMWTQKSMVEKLTYRGEWKCTVLNANFVDGYGATIDVVLVNGTLHEGDQIVVCGSQGKIVTSIQFLLTLSPVKLIGAKGTYLRHTKIEGGRAIKIIAQGLENAIGGHDLYVLKSDKALPSKWSYPARGISLCSCVIPRVLPKKKKTGVNQVACSCKFGLVTKKR